ncbi:growth factor receptor-bound protein 14-like [Limulus polyphemus]|uniref:Growth factor receptor-bound protein 14-like n=1 Tax=Limulus polyphemus TaxID=6850 RepID=A0ABM1BRH1_LIMPO|nr:growth factor receptor-bound protein 14-like [Limulus polyphemus]
MDCVAGSTVLTKMVTIQNMLHSGKNMPAVQSFLWFKEPTKNSWRKYFFRLEDNILRFFPVFDRKKPKQMYPLLDLQNCDIFLPIEEKFHGAPTKFYFCLKPKRNLERSASVLRWFCCASEKVQQCWIVALRLAKFGKKLVDNYREVKSRNNFFDNSSLYQSKIQQHSDINFDYLCHKTQVAMDFTGKFGHVVQNPAEVEAIAAAEAQKWKKKLASNQISQSSTHSTFEFGVHTVQPWFYTGMSRDEPTQLLTKYGTVDGVFLVRESHRNPASFVLSYVYNRKVHHTQILPMEEKNQLCYTLDGGKTKFYDLLQLVEFYQLNLGYLPTNLTYFFIRQTKKLEAT